MAVVSSSKLFLGGSVCTVDWVVAADAVVGNGTAIVVGLLVEDGRLEVEDVVDNNDGVEPVAVLSSICGADGSLVESVATTVVPVAGLLVLLLLLSL